MTTVGDYLRKLAAAHEVDPANVVSHYSELKAQGMQTRDALRMIEDELRKGVPGTELAEELPESPPAGGIDVDAFIEAAKAEAGEWITAAEVKEGDEFEVMGAGETDDETFDRPYLCVPVKYKGQDRKLRIGAKNAERIRPKLGKYSATWVGKKIQVTVVEVVKGLSKKQGIEVKRMILDGV